MRITLRRLSCLLFGAALGLQLMLASRAAAETLTYKGICDASAAVAIDANRFVVADDEKNTLRVYRRDQAEPLDQSIDLSKFLDTKPKKESDLEGAAVIGNRIYWISSHGNNKDGEVQKRRWRFFATEIAADKSPPVAAIGMPYMRLRDDLLSAPQLKDYKLKKAAEIAPEQEGGLNIEGLAATPAGGLLIGFRNPLHDGNALIVPLDNPAKVVEGERAILGDPIELDLGGRGIRSIERLGSTYLIVAGPPGDDGSFALFRWSGEKETKPQPLPNTLPQDLRPEAIFEISALKVQLLSDDGGVTTDGVECKDRDEDEKEFRSIVLDVGE